MKNVNKSTVVQIDPLKKDFTMIPKAILLDTRLSSDAVRLLILMLDNTDEWIMNTTYFSRILKWKSNKLSNATKELIDVGYLIRTKKSLGPKKGFQYIYQIFNYKSPKSDEFQYVPNQYNTEQYCTDMYNTEKVAKNTLTTEQTNLEQTNLKQTKTNNEMEKENNEEISDLNSFKKEKEEKNELGINTSNSMPEAQVDENCFSTELNESIYSGNQQKAYTEFKFSGLNEEESKEMTDYMIKLDLKTKINNWKAYAKTIIKDKDLILSKKQSTAGPSAGEKEDETLRLAKGISKKYYEQTQKDESVAIKLVHEMIIKYKEKYSIQEGEALRIAINAEFAECDDWSYDNISLILQ